jgi:peptidoglycan/LPS O-acetylase OafA/YrhL
MNYRREIDGLRALAVMPVILFHAGFQAFSGGFVGVDVFFVISGYLITSIIISEKQNGTFTLVGFYERRARRILPALFVVMFACLPFSLLWLLPVDLTDFSQSLIAVPLFSSNILFYLESGYFESAAELKPLLHTWSLAVEEQYYLLFPILLLLIWRLSKRRIVGIGILVVIALISLAAAQWGSRDEPIGNFFLLPTRGWELLIGALVACFLFAKDHSKIATTVTCQAFSLLGMFMIIYAVFAFDKRIPFPSLYTLIPTIGTGLLILFANEQTMVGKVLGVKVLVGIGLISYSAYLWHYPLFAFARHRSIEKPSEVLLIALAASALLLAYLTWRWIETPFRNKQRIGRNKVVVIGFLCSCVLVGIGLGGYIKSGFVDWLSPKEMQMFLLPAKNARMLYREGICYLKPAQTAFAEDCQGRNEVGGTLIWGDSHAAALSIGLRKSLSDVVQYTASGCPPIKDRVILERPHCKQINDFVMREIERRQPRAIFLHANWILYEDNQFIARLAETVRYVVSTVPSAQVIIVGGVPQWQPSLPKVMLLKGISASPETYLETPIWQELAAMDKELQLVANTHGGKFVSAIDSLCVSKKCQVVTKSTGGGLTLTAWDYGHLTEAGSVLLANRLLSK